MNTNHLDEFSVTLLSNASIDIYSQNNVPGRAANNEQMDLPLF